MGACQEFDEVFEAFEGKNNNESLEIVQYKTSKKISS